MQSKKLLFSYYSWLTYYLSYYFGNIAYPIIYPIITFTDRKVKFYPINNSSLEPKMAANLVSFLLETILIKLAYFLCKLSADLDIFPRANL